MKNKGLEKTVSDCFENITRNSWTWKRLTDEEKARFLSLDFDCIKGTENRRREIYFTIYSAFLYGCGYKPVGWREDADGAPTF